MTIHIEGMGVVGSILAWNLHDAGIDFTWSDNDAKIQAWRACTGLVYPSGNRDDQRAYNVWSKWLKESPWPTDFQRWAGYGDYWYISKNPPHGLKGEPVVDLGYLRKYSAPSIHWNAQRFIPATREFFNLQRKVMPDKSSEVTIVSHGFGERMHRVLWGWCTWMELDISQDILRHCTGYPMLYLREGRFKVYYADPVPETGLHYCGSNLIHQKVPKELEVAPKMSKWIDHLQRVTEGNVSVRRIIKTVQGWRPDAAKEDTAMARWIDGRLCCKPLWSSGVRHSPLIVESVFKELGISYE